MSNSFTSNMDQMSRLCDDALNSPTGIALRFTVDHERTLAVCKSRVVAAQNAFTSLRARARRLTSAEHGARDNFKRGPYDALTCRREELPNGEGWCLRLLPASDAFSDAVITAGDGSPMDDANERKALIDKMVRDFPHFTIYDYDRLAELDPGVFYDEPSNWQLKREQCDGRASAFGPDNAIASKPKPDYDPTARHVDLAEALTPGNLFEEGGEDEG